MALTKHLNSLRQYSKRSEMVSLRLLPVIAVVGRKKSGKTSMVKILIENLRAKGYRVMSAKHVDVKGFTIDKEGTDTWWHAKAGANPVVCISDSETAVVYRNGTRDFTLGGLVKYAAEDVDLIVVEGFSKWVIKDDSVAKIVMVNNRSEYEEYSRDVGGPVLSFCSHSAESAQGEILRAEEDFDRILKSVTGFLEDAKELNRILGQLPGLDCGRCSYMKCLLLARAMQRGEASIRDCVVKYADRKPKSTVLIEGKSVPLVPYISELIASTVLAMVSTLKGADVKGREHVEVRISGEPSA